MLERPFTASRRHAISGLQALAILSLIPGVALAPAVFAGQEVVPAPLGALPGAQRLVGGTLVGLIPLTILAAIVGSARLTRGVGRYEVRRGGLWVRPLVLYPRPGEEAFAIPWEHVLEVHPVRGGVQVAHVGESALARRLWPLVLPVDSPAEEERLLALLGSRASVPAESGLHIRNEIVAIAPGQGPWVNRGVGAMMVVFFGSPLFMPRGGPEGLAAVAYLVGMLGLGMFLVGWSAPRQGVIGLRPDGIERGGALIAWDRLEELAFADGWLAARGGRVRFLVRVGELPGSIARAASRPVARELPPWARRRRRLSEALGFAGPIVCLLALVLFLAGALLR